MTGLEKRLHRGLPDATSRGVPPLLTLERYMFRLLAVGFVLLTLALASGIVFSEQLFGKPVTFTHKNVFSVAGWLAFAVLLFGRWRYGWRGRTALKWILGGTLLLVLGYLGSKFVSRSAPSTMSGVRPAMPTAVAHIRIRPAPPLTHNHFDAAA